MVEGIERREEGKEVRRGLNRVGNRMDGGSGQKEPWHKSTEVEWNIGGKERSNMERGRVEAREMGGRQ